MISLIFIKRWDSKTKKVLEDRELLYFASNNEEWKYREDSFQLGKIFFENNQVSIIAIKKESDVSQVIIWHINLNNYEITEKSIPIQDIGFHGNAYLTGNEHFIVLISQPNIESKYDTYDAKTLELITHDILPEAQHSGVVFHNRYMMMLHYSGGYSVSAFYHNSKSWEKLFNKPCKFTGQPIAVEYVPEIAPGCIEEQQFCVISATNSFSDDIMLYQVDFTCRKKA